MSVTDIPLRKLLQLFYSTPEQRLRLLKADLRLDVRKSGGKSRKQGGDFYGPFWSDVRQHMAGNSDLRASTQNRILRDESRRRLYEQLTEGMLDLVNSKLKWTNEDLKVLPEPVSGNLVLNDLAAIVRVRGALYARVRSGYVRVVYPYFSETPSLPEEGGRLGLWVMQKSLTDFDPADMRIVDPLRRTFFSPQRTPLLGDEEEKFAQYYQSLIVESEALKT